MNRDRLNRSEKMEQCDGIVHVEELALIERNISLFEIGMKEKSMAEDIQSCEMRRGGEGALSEWLEGFLNKI